MAKKSAVVRDRKRQEMIARYAAKRQQLKAAGQFDQLHQLPRNSSPTRAKNRCRVTGRPRGYMRQFGVSRIVFRQEASLGNIPGVTKSSW